MHNAAIAALGLDAVYVGIHADQVAIPHVVRAFEAIGVAGNVTVPHKLTVAQLLIRLTPIAKELEAGKHVLARERPAGRRQYRCRRAVGCPRPTRRHRPWLLAGTGGAARAVAAAARLRHAALWITSREPARAGSSSPGARNLGVDAAVDDGRAVETVVNATPLGLKSEDALPFPDSRIAGARAALDLSTAAGETRWVRRCRSLGMRAADGRVMLVAQGAHAFERFFPGTSAPREIMSAAVERALHS